MQMVIFLKYMFTSRKFGAAVDQMVKKVVIEHHTLFTCCFFFFLHFHELSQGPSVQILTPLTLLITEDTSRWIPTLALSFYPWDLYTSQLLNLLKLGFTVCKMEKSLPTSEVSGPDTSASSTAPGIDSSPAPASQSFHLVSLLSCSLKDLHVSLSFISVIPAMVAIDQ